MQETQFQFLGWEDPLEEARAAHSSILTWRIPRTEEPGRLQSMRSQRVGQNFSNVACMHVVILTLSLYFTITATEDKHNSPHFLIVNCKK